MPQKAMHSWPFSPPITSSHNRKNIAASSPLRSVSHEGFGYIERMGEALDTKGFPVFAVRRFTEKPALLVAQEYVASGNYHWNAGMFFWRVSTFLENLKRHLPQTHAALEKLASTIGTRAYEKKLRAIYPKLENISVDYAILERATQQPGPPQVFVIPAEIGWSDIGSWAAVYELLAKQPGENIFVGPGHTLDASGNFLYSPSKFIAAIGVNDAPRTSPNSLNSWSLRSSRIFCSGRSRSAFC